MDTIKLLRRIVGMMRYLGNVASAFVVLIIGQYTLTSLLSYYGDTIQGNLTLASNYWQIMTAVNIITILFVTVICVFDIINLRTGCYTILYTTVITVAGAALLLLVSDSIAPSIVAILLVPWVYDLASHTLKTVRSIEAMLKKGKQEQKC